MQTTFTTFTTFTCTTKFVPNISFDKIPDHMQVTTGPQNIEMYHVDGLDLYIPKQIKDHYEKAQKGKF